MNNAISAISLLMVFLTVFQNINYNGVVKILEKSVPSTAQKAARKKFKNEIKRMAGRAMFTTTFRSFPITFSFITLFYLMLPNSVHIMKNSRISLWYFDINWTLFLFIEIAVLSFIIFSFYLIIKLIFKLFK